jgi:leucine dehydrogenase
MSFTHQEVLIRRGDRTGLPLIVAVHSTALGPAVGGCRMWSYPDWRDGLTDALRLSEGMSRKCAVAGLPNGGGKAVIVLAEGDPPGAALRRDALYDLGDLVESLGGRYSTGPDAGTGTADMALIGTRTDHVFCRPESENGSGDPSRYTALGVVSALHAVCRALTGSPDLEGRAFAIVGAGHVGEHLARLLGRAGARLVISDVNPAKRALADELGAEFLTPRDALTAPVDVLVPAALGGTLTRELVPLLRCAAIAGPANNQLAEPEVADLLDERHILWAPDYVVNAGGVIHALARELHHDDHAKAVARVEGIGDTLTSLIDSATAAGTTPARAAAELARARLEPG